MGVGIRVGSVIDEIGAPDFLNAFFSTISKNLEPEGWGSRFPSLLIDLYQGKLGNADVPRAQRELLDARSELQDLPPSKVVWDYSNPQIEPPWGKYISSHISNMSEYFVTSTGRNVFDVIYECFEDALIHGDDVSIEVTGEFPGTAPILWGSK